jgi:hypothetical protein
MAFLKLNIQFGQRSTGYCWHPKQNVNPFQPLMLDARSPPNENFRALFSRERSSTGSNDCFVVVVVLVLVVVLVVGIFIL